MRNFKSSQQEITRKTKIRECRYTGGGSTLYYARQETKGHRRASINGFNIRKDTDDKTQRLASSRGIIRDNAFLSPPSAILRCAPWISFFLLSLSLSLSLSFCLSPSPQYVSFFACRQFQSIRRQLFTPTHSFSRVRAAVVRKRATREMERKFRNTRTRARI